jgi:hypothetical protein
MTQEHRTQETAVQPDVALAPEPDELTDAELTLVVGGEGGDDTGPGGPTDSTGRSGM